MVKDELGAILAATKKYLAWYLIGWFNLHHCNPQKALRFVSIKRTQKQKQSDQPVRWKRVGGGGRAPRGGGERVCVRDLRKQQVRNQRSAAEVSGEQKKELTPPQLVVYCVCPQQYSRLNIVSV